MVLREVSRLVSRVVKRSNWLITTVTALFVLHAPLCTLACLDGANAIDKTDAAYTADTEQVSHADTKPSSTAGQSCHDEGPASSPPGVPGSQDDCGCENAANALVLQSSDSTTTSLQLFVPAAMRWERTASSASWDAAVAVDLDLPPPDILLLKSTLII